MICNELNDVDTLSSSFTLTKSSRIYVAELEQNCDVEYFDAKRRFSKLKMLFLKAEKWKSCSGGVDTLQKLSFGGGVEIVLGRGSKIKDFQVYLGVCYAVKLSYARRG